MRLSELTARISGEGADAWITHYEALAARERGADVIVLSVGDPDLDTPKEVVERAIEQLRAGDTHYAPAAGRLPLRMAIARAHAARSGQDTHPDQVVCLAGAQNALFAASLCLAGPGDEVMTLEPMYPTYPATLEVSGARMVRVPSASGFRPDLAALERLISPRTRALFWATPNNPSGAILEEAELEAIAALARRHDLWIVSDEVYAGLAPGGRVPSLAARLPEQVVTVSSLSKTHAMTGWRAGWLIAPREVARHVEALAMCMLFGLPGFIQEAAIVALANAAAAEQQIREYCRVKLQRFLGGLQSIPTLRAVEPQAGMFMLVDVSATGLNGYQFMRALYEAEGVSVLDGAAFGKCTQQYIRICFAAEDAAIDGACLRMGRFCEHPRLARGARG
ncbi:MAG TPA: pyridoxal phosphate-dependent aminotransferase [Steroidobacteraceae bacterium]|nr:pyridoxal phosphate-dependent aminotransferase [Steroidobacteraceae bacterium]